MTITINNFTPQNEVTLDAILAFEQCTKITLPPSYQEFLINKKGDSLISKGFFDYDDNLQVITAPIIGGWFPLTDQQRNSQLPIKKELQNGQYIKLIDFKQLMDSIESKGFCLTDWQPDLVKEFLPIGFTTGYALICLGIAEDNYNKIYQYTWLGFKNKYFTDEGEKRRYHKEDIYDFSLIADNFTDFVENLVEPKLIDMVELLPKSFSSEDGRTYYGTDRLKRLNELAEYYLSS